MRLLIGTIFLCIGLNSCTWWEIPPAKIWSCGEPITYGAKVYKTVQISDTVIFEGVKNTICQCWIKENLAYHDQIIPPNHSMNDETYTNGKIEMYCNNCDSLGGLYKWKEAMNGKALEKQGICPCGWHIPTDNEWQDLERVFKMPEDIISTLGHRVISIEDFNSKFGIISTDGRSIYPGWQKGSNFDSWGLVGYWTSSLVTVEDSIIHNIQGASDRQTVWLRIFRKNMDTSERLTDNIDSKFGYSIRCIKNECNSEPDSIFQFICD